MVLIFIFTGSTLQKEGKWIGKNIVDLIKEKKIKHNTKLYFDIICGKISLRRSNYICCDFENNPWYKIDCFFRDKIREIKNKDIATKEHILSIKKNPKYIIQVLFPINDVNLIVGYVIIFEKKMKGKNILIKTLDELRNYL
jgi:hypothetical protein